MSPLLGKRVRVSWWEYDNTKRHDDPARKARVVVEGIVQSVAYAPATDTEEGDFALLLLTDEPEDPRRLLTYFLGRCKAEVIEPEPDPPPPPTGIPVYP